MTAHARRTHARTHARCLASQPAGPPDRACLCVRFLFFCGAACVPLVLFSRRRALAGAPFVRTAGPDAPVLTAAAATSASAFSVFVMLRCFETAPPPPSAVRRARPPALACLFWCAPRFCTRAVVALLVGSCGYHWWAAVGGGGGGGAGGGSGGGGGGAGGSGGGWVVAAVAAADGLGLPR